MEEFDSFVFTHIPKCGGSSLRRLISESALSSGILSSQIHIPGEASLGHDKNLGQLSNDEFVHTCTKKVKILADHSKYNPQLYKSLGMNNPFVFTVVRAPFERFISHYNFFYKKVGHGKLKGKNIQDLSAQRLEQIVQQQANVLSAYMLNCPPGYDQTAMLQNRIEELITRVSQQIHVIGTLDDMTSCLDQLKVHGPSWLQWSDVLPQINTNSYNLNFPDIKRVRQLFVRYNQLDIRLYQLMRSIKNLKGQAL